MDYLGDNFSSRKRKVAGANGSAQGELVTPTPTNYTQPKALTNETFIDGQKASTAVGRPNPQIGQAQQASPKPNALSGDLVTQSPATFKPTPAVQNPIIDGQVSRPTLGMQPTVNAVNPVNSGATATQSLTQMAQKPTIPPYQPAANPVNQYGGMPPNNPAVGNVGGSVGTTPPAQSITTRLANGVSKLASATPALQAGMNASNIMNQEANFAQKIHAGSIADPNFGNELMGDKQQFSRTFTPPAKPTTGVIGVGRAGTEPMPEQYINSRAGQSVNPAYTQYTANHPQNPAIAPANQPTAPLRDVKVPTFSTPTNPVANTNPMGNQPVPQQYQSALVKGMISGALGGGMGQKMPTSMNDVASGTGYIKGGNGAFKNGMGFVQNENGMMGSDGKQRKPSDAPSMDKLGKQLDVNALNRLSAQRESGAITAAQASQIYDQYKQDTAPLAQQPQMAMQRMAANGNIDAAKQLTGEAEQQSLGQYRKDTSAVQQKTLDAANDKEQYTRNSPVTKLADDTAQNSRDILSNDPNISHQAYAKWKLTNPTKMEKVKRKVFDPTTSLPLAEQEDLVNPYYPTSMSSATSPVAGNKLPPKKGESLNGLTPEQESSFPAGHELVGGDGKVVYRKNEDGTYLNLKTGKNEHPF